jgi:hypothetical protein
MKRGDLVRVRFSTSRIPNYPIGIILKEEKHAWDTRFFTIILPDGNTELFSENYLEVIPIK